MNLAITAVADAGNAQKERIVMKALLAVDVGRFAIFRTAFVNGQLTTTVNDVYWFADEEIKSGDLVVLYSRSGADSKRILKDGGTAHFFYWHRPESLWTDKGFVPVLVHTGDWQMFVVPPRSVASR